MVWQYRYVLVGDLGLYVGDGWKVMGRVHGLGGWDCVLIRRKGVQVDGQGI
jgi:hypothetical protein